MLEHRVLLVMGQNLFWTASKIKCNDMCPHVVKFYFAGCSKHILMVCFNRKSKEQHYVNNAKAQLRTISCSDKDMRCLTQPKPIL